MGEAVNSSNILRQTGVILVSLFLLSCGNEPEPETTFQTLEVVGPRPDIYAEFTLTADLSSLTDGQKQMIKLLIDASEIMDTLFWRQSYGDDYASWLQSLDDADTRRFAELNYGPWDRLDDDKPFVEGVGRRPPGANFYPRDMSIEEFEAAYLPGKAGAYSLVRRDPEGGLTLVPYHVAYQDELQEAAKLLREAASHAESADFANYLKLRAAALISDDFQVSDLYWMDVRDNKIDVVIGPIESYEDALFGYRTAYESYVLIKDLEWSDRLSPLRGISPGTAGWLAGCR